MTSLILFSFGASFAATGIADLILGYFGVLILKLAVGGILVALGFAL